MRGLINAILILLLLVIVSLVYLLGFDPELINLNSESYASWFSYAYLIGLCSCLMYLTYQLYVKAKIFQKGGDPDGEVSDESSIEALGTMLRMGVLSLIFIGFGALVFVGLIPYLPEESRDFVSNLILYTSTGIGVGLFVYALMIQGWWIKIDPKRKEARAREKAMIREYSEETGEALSEQSIWEKLFQLKPVYTDRNVTMKHSYDGIRELDNPPPPWFMFLFYGTIAFGVFYFFYYMALGIGPTQEEEYIAQVQKAEVARTAFLAEQAENVDENTVTLLTDEASLLEGEKIFSDKKCATSACHGEGGRGAVGPNLTDEYWKHGGGIKNVFKTIKYGVVVKGMKSWQDELSPSKIQKVASYVLSLQGTVTDGKEPEGELWVESIDSSQMVQDTTRVDTAEMSAN